MPTYQQIYDGLKESPENLQAAIEDAVRIDRQAVLHDLMRQAQVFSTWGYLLALAETEAKRAKLSMEEDALPAARVNAAKLLKEREEKVTVKAKDDLAIQDMAYRAAQAIYITASERVSIYKRVLEALSQKRDMMQSLNSRAKVELGSLPQEDFGWMGETPDLEARAEIDASRQPNTEPQNVDTEVATLAKKWRSKRRELRNK